MRDQFNVDLEDSDLLSEVELSISLMIAGTESAGHLSRDEIDHLLGVTPVAPDTGTTGPSPSLAPRPRERGSSPVELFPARQRP